MENLEIFSVCEMTDEELSSVDGGLLPLLIVIGAALILSSCGNNNSSQSNGGINTGSQVNVTKGGDCINCTINNYYRSDSTRSDTLRPH